MAELTINGLSIRRFPEIQSQLRNAILQNVSSSIVFDEDTIFSQLVDIISLEISNLEQALQAIYDSLDRDKAEGTSLDSLMNLIGLRRIPAAFTSGSVTFFGDDGSTIPTGAVLENPSTLDRFQVNSQTVLSQNSCRSCSYTVGTVQDSTAYTVTVNGNEYTYTSGVGATSADIVEGLALVIESDTNKTWTASTDINPDRLVITTDSDDNINCEIDSLLTPDQVSLDVPVTAQVVGNVRAPAGSITNLVTPVGGIDRVYNYTALGSGRLRETDAEFRIRAAQSLSLSGASTLPAIRVAVLNIPEVSGVTIVENVTNVVDVDGRPPHFFEVIVTAPTTDGLDETIATTIFNDKPAGIETFGNTTVTIQDDIGADRVIKFSRPQGVFIAVRVTYSKYSEEVFPDNGDSLIKQSVVEYGDTLPPGEDVIAPRFNGAVYQVPGIGNMVVETQVLANTGDTPDPLSWSTDIIPIGQSDFAAFNQEDVYTVLQ